MAFGLINILNGIGTVFTIRNILNTIELLLSHEESIMYRISKAHRESAIQGIEAAKKGNQDLHLAVVIGDLRKIYNLLKDTANRKARWYEWLDDAASGVSSRTYHSMHSYEEMAEVAAMISLSHKSLKEYENAKDWAKLSLDAFDKYESLSMRIISTPDLKGSSQTGYWEEAKDRKFIVEQKEIMKKERNVLKDILRSGGLL